MKSSRFLSVFALFVCSISFAHANLSISPLKHELTIEAGKEKSEIIKVTNNSDTPITLYTSKEDFIAGDDTGTPTFVKPQNQTSDEYSLSSWINIENANITLAKGETREIRFMVKVPPKGEPGGHYGAIFFSPGAPSGVQVAVIQRLGVLILINVPGDMQIAGSLESFRIGKKLENIFTSATDFNSFPILFETKFKNEGNTHLKPTGRIELIDENGDILKNVGKEAIASPAGAFIGEKMVDYIPVNDGLGNVLPKSERRFESVWEGFGYPELQPNGTKIVKFKDLTSYYADRAAEKRAFLQFWESIHTRTVDKVISANLTLSYEGKDKEKKEFRESKKITVQYEEQYVGINYLVIIILLGLLSTLGYYVFIAVPASKERLRNELMEAIDNQRKK
ncbi:MAG: DUF916 domain-containing protein [Candidatus Gracilibacteria bacterium]|nr:DUF916 domain-containing protein [Candidatus Gracilibacteria bacterium]